jgi:hypothetical protein
MKKKASQDWADILLASSGLPADEFTMTTGNNFGLDGFSFDTPNNEGVKEGPHPRMPETKGMSALPDGFTGTASEDEVTYEGLTDSDDGIEFDTDVAGTKEASLVDLQWLDPTQGQDPDRLPDNEATLNSIPTLEEAWGANRRTDGFGLVPNQDRETAQYLKSLAEKKHSQLPGNAFNEAIRKAARRAHFGHDLTAIRQELVDTLGHDAVRARKAMQLIESEYGLLGNVFVRAAAFPGLKNGKWVKELRRVANGARYVITDDQTVADKLSMQMVSEVPWKQALNYYTPLLKAAGYKLTVTASGHPKDILKAAFLTGPKVEAEPERGNKPVVKPVVATEQEVQAALAEPAPAAPAVKSAEEKAATQKERKALVQLARWVKAGRLSQQDVLRLKNSGADALTMLRTASKLMVASNDTPVYDGTGAHLPKDAQQARQAVWASLEEQQVALEEGLQKKVQARLLEVVKAGLLTTKEAQRIVKMGKSAKVTQEIISAAVRAAQEMRKIEAKPIEAKPYSGAVQKAAQAKSIPDAPPLDANQIRIQKLAKQSGIKAGEFIGLLKWARQKMTEGSLGQELDQLLKARFAPPLLKAASGLLKETRAQHEGLSGRLYVDASAYASPSGLTGCERGGLKHRANAIKHVLAMDRCAGCVYANAKGHCQQYNKKIVATVPVDDPKAYQKAALREAASSDAEQTAALFNPQEFGLHNGSLDDVELGQHATPEKLGAVLFGGLEIEE